MSQPRTAMLWVRQALRVLPGWLAAALFFSGTLTLTSNLGSVWGLPSAFAIVTGVVGFTLWLIWYVLTTDSLRPRQRRRP